MNGRPVAFVFQGGGSLTANQVGALRALIEAGIRPDLLVGSSAGALNAVMFAADPTHGGLDRLEALWRTLSRRSVAPLSPTALARAVAGRASSLLLGRTLRELVRANTAIERLEDAVVPVVVVATDLMSGEPAMLRRGSVEEALLASSAIPVLFPPVLRDGRSLVDGSVSADTPVLQAEQLGASVCFVLPSATQLPSVGGRLPVMPLAYRALNHFVERNSRRDLAAARSEVHVLAAPVSNSAHLLDFRDTDRLIAHGYRLVHDELSRESVRAAAVGI